MNFIDPYIDRDTGYEINWDQIVGSENDEASRLAAETMDGSGLEAMFERIVEKLPR